MLLMQDIETFFAEAGDELTTIHAFAFAANNRTHKFDPYRLADHCSELGDNPAAAAWDFFDSLGDWQNKAVRLVLDGRGAKGFRVLYKTITAPTEENDSATALVNALHETSTTMMAMVEQSVQSQKALTTAFQGAHESSLRAIEAASAQLGKIQDMFITEVAAARAGERAARSEIMVQKDEACLAKVAFAEAEAEHTAEKQSLFDEYARDPKKLGALFLLAKGFLRFAIDTKEQGLAKALTPGTAPAALAK
jgi:hypothetical protein